MTVQVKKDIKIPGTRRIIRAGTEGTILIVQHERAKGPVESYVLDFGKGRVVEVPAEAVRR